MVRHVKALRGNNNADHLLSGALLVLNRLIEFGISLRARVMKEKGKALGAEGEDCEDGKNKRQFAGNNWANSDRLHKTNTYPHVSENN